MRFDHLVHLVPDLGPAFSEYERLGFRPEMGGDHPGHGTHNAAVRSGSTYIELLGVRDWTEFRKYEADRQKRYPKLSFKTEEILNAGGGSGGFAVEVDQITEVVARLQAAGLPIAPPTMGKILRSDGSRAEWGIAALTEGPSWLPFFIQYAGPRRPRHDPRPWILDHVLIETADPAGGAGLLAQLLDQPLSTVGPGQYAIPLDGCSIRVAPGPAERITTVVFSRPTDPAGEVFGIRYSRSG